MSQRGRPATGHIRRRPRSDGLTTFAPTDAPNSDTDGDLEAEVIAAFHQHMDRPASQTPSYGGSMAGRRLGSALTSAGLEVLVDASSVWHVHATDDVSGPLLLDRLIRFVVEAARELGTISSADLASWERSRRAALARRTLTARVGHRDLLARKPARSTG